MPSRRRPAHPATLVVALLLIVSVAALAGCGDDDDAASNGAGPSTSVRGLYTDDLERLAPEVLEGSEPFRQAVATIRACIATIGSPACSLQDLAQVESAAVAAAEMQARIDALPDSIEDPDASARATVLLQETSAALGGYQAAAQRFADGGCADEGFDIAFCVTPLRVAADAGREVDRLLAGWEVYAS